MKTRHARCCRVKIASLPGRGVHFPFAAVILTRTQGSQGTSGPAQPGPPTWHPPARRLRPRAIPVRPSKPSSERIEQAGGSQVDYSHRKQPRPPNPRMLAVELMLGCILLAAAFDSCLRCRAWGSDVRTGPRPNALIQNPMTRVHMMHSTVARSGSMQYRRVCHGNRGGRRRPVRPQVSPCRVTAAQRCRGEPPVDQHGDGCTGLAARGGSPVLRVSRAGRHRNDVCGAVKRAAGLGHDTPRWVAGRCGCPRSYEGGMTVPAAAPNRHPLDQPDARCRLAVVAANLLHSRAVPENQGTEAT